MLGESPDPARHERPEVGPIAKLQAIADRNIRRYGLLNQDA